MNIISTLIRRPRSWRTPAALVAAAAATAGAVLVTTATTAGPGPIQTVGYQSAHAYAPPPNAHLVTNVDDYPAKKAAYDTANGDTGFFFRNCTDFVAYRLRDEGFSGFKNAVGDTPQYWGNAYNWAAAARGLGIPVDSKPTVGAVAVFPSNWHSANGYDYVGGNGHVAVVSKIAGGTVWMEDYNYYAPRGEGLYHNHPMATDRGVTFIHFLSAGSTPAPPPSTKDLTLRVADASLAGHYASARINNGDVVQASVTAPGPWERFTFIPVPGKAGAYYLKSKATNQYVSARFNLSGSQRGTLYADVANPGRWETFYEQHVGADQAFYVYDNAGTKWYVATEMNNGGVLRARTTPAAFNQNVGHGSWELFYVGS